jgi:hypothetical protein
VNTDSRTAENNSTRTESRNITIHRKVTQQEWKLVARNSVPGPAKSAQVTEVHNEE